MKRRVAAFMATAFLVAGVFWVAWPRAARRERGLNVLLVTVDTLRADATSGRGGRAQTPWIDRLAAAGLDFERAHAHNVLTLPSHANILSGLYPYQHGVRENAGYRFPAHLDSIATLLKAQGYRTGAFVSGFPLDSRFGLDRGFDVYDDAFADGVGVRNFELPERRAEETVALAKAFVENGAPQPYLAFVHLYDPHTPYQAREPFVGRHPGHPYFDEVEAVDSALEPLFAPLIQAGRGGRTLVVLTADHGEGLGDHGEPTHGFFAYESTLRVPLIVFAPRLFGGRSVTDPVRHVDVLPTILDALDLAAPAGLAGRSLLGLAAGETPPEEATYFEALSGVLTRGWAPLTGIVLGGRKYIDLPLPELYDLHQDPNEARNLAERDPDVLARLRVPLARIEAADRRTEPGEELADTRRRLEALGYLGPVRAPAGRRYTVDDDPKRLVELDAMMQEVVRRQLDGDLRGALDVCRKVVERRPRMLAGLLQLAHIERKLGDDRSAAETLRRALELEPGSLSAAVLLATILSETGRAREAVRLLEPHLDNDESLTVDAVVIHGVALAQTGQLRPALSAFERALALDRGNSMTLVQIATVQLALGRLDEARSALEGALAANSRFGLAHHTLGLLEQQQGRMGEAEANFRRALALDPDAADTLLNLGVLLVRAGRPAAAQPLLEHFLRVAPPGLYTSEFPRVRAILARDALPGPI